MPLKYRYTSSEGGSIPRARYLRGPGVVPLAGEATTKKEVEPQWVEDLTATPSEQPEEPITANEKAPFRTDDTVDPNLPSPRGDNPQGCWETFLHSVCGVRPPLNVVIAMDSFKGSMTSREAAAVVEAALAASKITRVFKLPMSDGGEGFLNSFRAICRDNFELVRVPDVVGPFGEPLPSDAVYLYDVANNTAVIESATAVGFTLATNLDPMRASSYGLGQLIAHALDRNVKSICVGVGGTATVDGGTGLSVALGAKYVDEAGNALGGQDGNLLQRVAQLDVTQMHPRIAEVDFLVAADVTNALLGTEGAVPVFGPQKGVTADQVPMLDHQMQRFASLVEAAVGATGLSMTPGTGCGGGIGFALSAFCRAKIAPGFKILADKARLSERIKEADIVITGEGRFDASSLHGKLPVEVARLAKQSDTKCFLFTGKSEQDVMDMPEEGISCILPMLDSRASSEEVEKAQANAKELLFKEVTRSVKLLRLGQQVRL